MSVVLAALRRGTLALFALTLAACGGSGGGSAFDGVAVPADVGSQPQITRFAPAEPVTAAGRSMLLSWAVQGASTLTMQPGGIDVTGKTSWPVTPDATTTYTLVAANGAAKAEKTAQLRVFDWTETRKTLDDYLAVQSMRGIVGYSLIIFDREGTLFQQAGGNQNDGSVNEIASATKLPSAAAILTLVDEGKLDLDAPISTYLAANPAFSLPADKAAITMRMLLSHTSGLPGLQDMEPVCLNVAVLISLESCAQSVADSTLVTAPGSAFNYGAGDYQLAGYIATLLSGQSWQDFFAERIAGPVGMPTFTYGSGSNPRIAGSASTNVADYAAFLRMLHNDGMVGSKRVLSSAMVAAIKRDEIKGLPVRYSPFSAARAANYPGYGLGVFMTAASLIAPSPGPEFTDPGLFGTVPWFDEGLGYGAVLLTTTTLDNGLNLGDALRADIIRQYIQP